MTGSLRQYTVQVNSTQELVYRTLRDEIVSMELRPGTLISTQETADRLAVSRTPVREAFIRLQREKLLDITPQKGTRVSRISLERVYQERFIREALEIENMDVFITAATQADLARMEQNIQLQQQAMENKLYLDYIELDNSFHQISMHVTKQSLGADIMCQMNGHYDRIRLLTAWSEDIALRAIDEHKQLVEYIRQRSAAQAKQLLRHHLQQLYVHERALMQKWPDYFEKE